MYGQDPIIKKLGENDDESRWYVNQPWNSECIHALLGVPLQRGVEGVNYSH